MNKILFALPVILLCGCASTTPPKIINHDVFITTPCKITLPAKPVMPLTDTGSVNDDIFVKTKKALAEIDIRKGYEAELEAAAGSCK
jgi:hypothetical protein